MSSEHATVATTTVPAVEAVPDRVVAPAPVPTGELRVAPAWSREEDPFVTDPDGPDERRADAVAEALLAAAPPRDLPGTGDVPGETPPGGVPLPPTLRAWAERVTAADLHAVRLHRSPAHDRATDFLAARAFTRGSDVVLDSQVAPFSTAAGLATLAHELGHVLAPPANGRIGRDEDEDKKKAAETERWEIWLPPDTIEDVIKSIPEVTKLLKTITWEESTLAGWTEDQRKADAPKRVLDPDIFTVSTRRHVVQFNKARVAVGVTEQAKPADPATLPRQGLLDLSTGQAWVLGRLTRGKKELWKLRASGHVKASDGLAPGTSSWMVLVPAIELTEQQVKRFQQEAKVVAAKAAGPPGWSRDQVTKLRKLQAAKEREKAKDESTEPPREPESDRESTGDEEGAGGQGKEGTGIGGGGTDADPAEAKPGGDGKPLRGPTTVEVGVGGDGNPVLKITIDRAATYIGLREGESTDELGERVDKAVETLQQSRDPASSVAQIRDGATETGFVQPKGSTDGVLQSTEQAEKQAGSTTLHTTPGENQVTGKGGLANAPEYPSKIDMSGRDPQFPPTTVRGATNEFTMTLDYAARSVNMQDEVWNRLQNIQFYWEIIDVSAVNPSNAPLISQDQADKQAPGTDLGAGEQQTPMGALGTNFSRDMNAIAEDQQKDIAMMSEQHWTWEARAAYLGVIGLSNTVRMIGSIIGSFIDTLTQPLNARSMGFDYDGDFIVRCVATPLVSDEARADPEHHVIRKSSISVLPIRVQSINARATEAVGREEADLKAKQAALAKAEASGSEAERAKAQGDVDAVREAGRRSGQETYAARVAYVREQVTAARALQKHRAAHAPSDEWSDAEVGLAIRLFAQQQPVEAYLDQMERALEAMTKDGHEAWVGAQADQFNPVDGKREFRPRMVLASEETGQVSELLCMLGQLSPGADAPWRWALVDITSPGTREIYVGTSSLAGAAGRAAAIRDAFRAFAEGAGYGRGSLAIQLPRELIDAVGPVDVEATMRSAPGDWGRVKKRLEDLARVAGAVALFLSGPAAVVVGAIAGVAGAVVSVDALFKRSRTSHLLEGGTLFDILGVIGGVASVVSLSTMMTADAVNAAVQAKAASGGVKELPKWVRTVGTIDQVVHVQGQVAGVLTLLRIPIELVVQWGEIEASGDSPGQKSSRKLRALLHALETGSVTVVGLAGGFGNREPAGRSKGEPEGQGPKEGEQVPESPGAKPPVEEVVPVADPDAVSSAKALAAKRLAEAAQAEREVAPGKDEEILPDKDGRTGSGTPKGVGEPQAEKGIPDKNAASRDEVLATLEARVGQSRPIAASDVPPPKPGEYGAPTSVAAEAVASYDRAVAEVGGKREVGIFYNPNTGEFQVMVGTEHAVNSPRAGDGWRALVHLHPNPENVITFRLPAPQDIEGSVQAAMRNGSHVEYVQSTLPDGTTMMTKVTITTKPLKILVEMPGQHGEPPRVIEVASTKDYVDQYNRDSRAMDPSSNSFKWMMADLDAYYRRQRREEGRTSSGTLTEPPVATPEEPTVATEADINRSKQELERLRGALKDPKEQAVIDDELQTLERLRKEREDGRDVTKDLADLNGIAAEYRRILMPIEAAHARALAARTRKAAGKMKKGEVKQELTDIANEADRLADALENKKKTGADPRETLERLRSAEAAAARREEVTVIELSDPNELKLVRDFILERSGELSQEPVGQLLLERLLAYLETAEALYLKQSPRSAGHEVATTAPMREAVLATVKAKGYPDYYIAAFEEGVRLGEKQGRKDGWPRDAAGRSWEVDHVAELWLGGADDPSNYLALPESLHDLKSNIFKELMFRHRDRSNPGEQTDRREK